MKQTLGLTTTVFVDKRERERDTECVRECASECASVDGCEFVCVRGKESANGTLHFTIWSFSVLVIMHCNSPLLHCQPIDAHTQ